MNMVNENNAASISLRNLLLFILASIILLGIGYKFLEYKTASVLVDLHKKSWAQELSLTSKSQENQRAYKDSIDNLLDPKITPSKSIEELSKLNSLNKLYREHTLNYLATMRSNQKDYENLVLPSRILLGKSGSLVRGIIDNQLKYYQEEIGGAEVSLVSSDLIINTFDVWKDFTVSNDFVARGGSSLATFIPKNFPDIATLEKYTKGNFRYENDEKIKKYFPENYEYLTKAKTYFALFYEIAKDFVAGDLEAAGYKSPRLAEEEIEINPDFDRLFSEGEKDSLERSKKIAEHVFKLVKTTKDFEDTDAGKNPLGNVAGWKDDLILCQLYNYKSQIYQGITEEYPKAKNTDELLLELDKISPRTESIDSRFDKTSLKFTNDEEVIRFECKDKEENKTYTYEILK